MDARKSKVMLKALKRILLKYGTIEDIQDQEINMVFIIIHEYRYVVLSRGMQH
jgi:hypothetical protein